MADRPRFGPAGIPPAFHATGAPVDCVPAFLHHEGLDAFEYEAIYWGRKPRIGQEKAERLGEKARENDVRLSMHGSYFINLCGENKTVEASKKRLLACATAAEWMKSYVVVFHIGFYGRRPHELAFRNCLTVLGEIVETMNSMGIRNAKLGPETSGKPSQLGSLDEVLRICEAIERTQLSVDWAHLHARDMGRFRTVADFRKVVEKIELRLGTEAARNMHCHFTKIEFTEKGERKHHALGESRYGPDFSTLARVIADFKLRPVMISESPLLDLDAIKMRDILRSML